MGTARTRRTPVPPVEATDDVAPLVEDAAPPAPLVVTVDGAQVAAAAAEVGALSDEPEPEPEPEPVLPTRFVVARHEGLATYAVLARTSLEDWDGWSYVEDMPEGEPPLLPARFAPAAD